MTIPGVIKVATGIDWAETWEMSDEDRNVLNLTGYSYVFEVREKTGAIVVTGTCSITDATGGLIKPGLTAEQIATLDQRIYQWVLTETDTLGNDTPFTGTLEVEEV